MVTTERLSWTQVLDQIADTILGILSLASKDHGVSRLDMTEFYQVFADLESEFPNLLPVGLDLSRTGQYVYSDALGDALQRALSRGIRIANPHFQYLEIPADVAERNVERLRKRLGNEFLTTLSQAAESLAKRVPKK
jgi:hypothetical protein